jgi:hypothetical protein
MRPAWASVPLQAAARWDNKTTVKVESGSDRRASISPIQNKVPCDFTGLSRDDKAQGPLRQTSPPNGLSFA